MRSAMHHKFGEPAHVLAMEEAPIPEPGPGKVRIRTILSPIHNHDIWTVRGSYGYKPELPAIGGSEGVGIIDALGPDVTGFQVGQRVATASVHGSWSEYFIAPAGGLLPVPDAISDRSAAQLIAMPFSAICLLDFLNVQSGDWVIQNAANGAVGKMLFTLAKARGVNVIGLVRRDAGVEEMSQLGIDNVVSTASEGWKDRVRHITGDAPIRAAVDSIGGQASGDLVGLLGENGLLVSFGSMEGAPMQIPSGDLIFKQATVKGFWGSTVIAQMAPEKRVALLTEIVTLVANGTLNLPVEGVFGLDQVADAMRASLTPGKSGKVLLRP